MTNIKSVQPLYFSPTGSTRKIISAITESLKMKASPSIDLTLEDDRKKFTGKVDGDLVLIGTPVYAGTAPWPFLESLQKINGKGRWAVPVAVYGNRSPDTTIEELSKLLRGRGFKVLAAATFVAKHSFAVKEHPWGMGRPDDKDMAAAAEFGREIARKARTKSAEINVSGSLKAYGRGFPVPQADNPMVDAMPPGYHTKILDLPKTIWSVTVENKDSCKDCMSCAKSCPTDAISQETLKINDEKCIRCMACIAACPEGVMKLVYSNTPTATGTVANLDKIFAIRKEAQTFL